MEGVWNGSEMEMGEHLGKDTRMLGIVQRRSLSKGQQD